MTPILLNFFIEGLDDGTVQTQEIPADGMLGAAASTLEGGAVVQRSLSAGKVAYLGPSWTSVKALKVSSVHVGMHLVHQYRLGQSWREQLCREGPEGSGGP